MTTPANAHISMNVDTRLLETAMRISGIADPQTVLHTALQAWITRENAKRLIALGGSDPNAASVPRRRPRRA